MTTDIEFKNLLYDSLYELIGNNTYLLNVTFSNKFKPYNARAKKRGKEITISLSKEWITVNSTIVSGLFQVLLGGFFKLDKKTVQMDLYYNFIKNVHLIVPKNNIDPLLKESFDRVNSNFFQSSISVTNLVFFETKRILGQYDFHTDTIRINKKLLTKKPEVLDYVMYHEMLHKDIKFKPGLKRSRFHSKNFKDREKQFPNYNEIENELRTLNRPKFKLNFSFLRQ